VKLALLPAAAWALASWLAPDYALAALLLSGVSTGVTAPFFAGMLGADVNRTLRVVVLTSLLAPLSLPALVSLIMGARIEISFFHMARMLLMVIFIPLIAAGAARKIIPGLKAALTRLEYPLALLLFFMINLGVFSSYSEFILGRRDEVLRALAVSFGLAGFYCSVGWLLGRAAAPRLDGLTGAVGLTFINNVLIIVFAARFFGPKCPLLAAAYMIPLFVMLIPLRRLGLQKA
jgi:BASS family bile acid:Na+ symporter